MKILRRVADVQKLLGYDCSFTDPWRGKEIVFLPPLLGVKGLMVYMVPSNDELMGEVYIGALFAGDWRKDESGGKS